MTQPEGANALHSMADAWQEGGLQAPRPAPASWSDGCYFPDCTAMTYVEVRTAVGSRALCFRHFESVKDEVDRKTRAKAENRSASA